LSIELTLGENDFAFLCGEKIIGGGRWHGRQSHIRGYRGLYSQITPSFIGVPTLSPVKPWYHWVQRYYRQPLY